MHIIRVSQARSFTLSSASELVSVSKKVPSHFLSSALHVFGGADAEKEDYRKNNNENVRSKHLGD